VYEKDSEDREEEDESYDQLVEDDEISPEEEGFIQGYEEEEEREKAEKTEEEETEKAPAEEPEED
jgi:hypothetical protein